MLAQISSRVVSVSNGLSRAFLYESAKDNLKWNNLSEKEHIYTVMKIGEYRYFSDEDFAKLINSSSHLSVSEDDILSMYKNYEESQNGNNSNQS